MKIYSKSSASILTAVLLVTLGASAAQAGVDVSDVELDFSNGGIDVGAGAGDGDSFQYDDVVPGSATQVNALVTVSDFVNVETVTFVDENDHSGNKPIDFQFYDVSDGEATITVEFFDGDAADDGYTTPISLDNLSVTVKDIDVYQSIEVISPDSYELSESPASVLQVTEDTDAGTTTFAETEGDSYGDADEEVWAVLTYDSTSEFSLRGYVYLGGSFTIEFKATAYTTPTPYNEDSTTQSSCESTGVFLTVTGGVADRTASSPIVYGACGLTAGAPYSLTVEPMGSVGAKRMLGSGAIPSSGALERTTHLPVLDAGNYKVVLTSRGLAGEVLTLTNHVSVSGDQKYGSISAESLQPMLK